MSRIVGIVLVNKGQTQRSNPRFKGVRSASQNEKTKATNKCPGPNSL